MKNNKIICSCLFTFLLLSTAMAENYPEGSYPEGSYPHGSYPHGSYPHGSYPHGSYPHGSYPHGSYPHGSYPRKNYDFAGCVIERARAIECPEGTYKYIGSNHLININESDKNKILKTNESLGNDSKAGKAIAK